MTATSSGARRAGIAIFVLYVLAAALTLRVSGRHLRPLFQGIGPGSPYQWVQPPPEFETGNVEPTEAHSDAVLGPSGSPTTGVSTSDAQFVVNLPEGAVPPRPEDTLVAFTVTPLDPAELGAVPASLRPNGNAYRVQAAYQPSGQAIERLDKAGSVFVRMPEPFGGLLYSADGNAWEELAAELEGSLSSGGAEFIRSGYYLGAASASVDRPRDGGAGSNGGVVAVVGAVVVLALAFGLGPALYRRLRR